MNTTATIFKPPALNYTVVGARERGSEAGLSAILLNRGGRYQKRAVFERLEKQGFDEIISVEVSSSGYEIEELSVRFPTVTFLLLSEEASVGARINQAVAESRSKRFFVLWNDLTQIQGGGARKIAERLSGRLADSRQLLSIPALQNNRLELLPTAKSPAVQRGIIQTLPFVPLRDAMATLYPFDAVGIYDRDRFKALGGFDPAIRSPYWQYLDFGFRAWLWGESIRTTTLVKLSYDGEAPAENQTPDEGSKRFYLKNLAPAFHPEGTDIPFSRFLPYLFRSGTNPLEGWREFARERLWVRENSSRFACDARRVLERWERS